MDSFFTTLIISFVTSCAGAAVGGYFSVKAALSGERKKRNYELENAIKELFYNISDQIVVIVKMVTEMEDVKIEQYGENNALREIIVADRYRIASSLALWKEKENSVYSYLINAIEGRHAAISQIFSKIKEAVGIIDGIAKQQAVQREKGQGAQPIDVNTLSRQKDALIQIVNSFPKKGLFYECFKE